MKAREEAVVVAALVVGPAAAAAAHVVHVELAVAVPGVVGFVEGNYRSRNVLAQSWHGLNTPRKE